MFVDTHCHLTMLDLTPYNGDLDLALAARAEGVSKFMAISVDLDDHIALAEIAKRHEDVGYTVGVHPCEDVDTMARATTEYLTELAQSEKVWALGETGLDYYHSTDFINEQKIVLLVIFKPLKMLKTSSCSYVQQNMIPWILFELNNLHMVFCTVLLRTGKQQKLYGLWLLYFLFRNCFI